MKKFFYTIVFAVITSFAISACTDENIKPADSNSSDPCQFGGPGCPKGTN
jgi:hypothetical protein